jgi:hypothetical protein
MRNAVAALVMLGISGGSGGEVVPPFNPTVTVTSSSTIDAGSGADDWVARASIKRRPSDNALVMAYYKATRHAGNEGDLNIRFSDDDGATWTAENTTLGGAAVSGFPMNPTVSAGEDAGEPMLYVAPNGDLLIHMWRVDYSVSLGGTWQARSSDGGETWTTPAQVTFAGTGEDDDIIFATDDEFVWDRTIYAGARVYTGGADGTPSRCILIKSDDSGATWEQVSVIMDDDEGDSPDFGGQEVGIEYVGNNTIIAMIRDNPHTKSFRRYSTNMGATWGTLTDVTSLVGIAGRQRVYTRMHLQGEAGWWKDPMLLMVGFVHQTPTDSQDRRNAIWISPDRGLTWDGPHYLDSTTEDAGYGDLFAKSDGTYAVVSYQGTLLAASLKQYSITLSGL